jgi:hypothetical protein
VAVDGRVGTLRASVTGAGLEAAQPARITTAVIVIQARVEIPDEANKV